jgi:hypothetical protein
MQNTYKTNNTLLCTISSEDQYETINNINRYYNISNKRIFILTIEKNDVEFVYTYNIDGEIQHNTHLENTFMIHRKKEFNTLFTINAINLLAKEKGVDSKDFKLDWQNYKDSLIISKGNVIICLRTKLHDIITL